MTKSKKVEIGKKFCDAFNNENNFVYEVLNFFVRDGIKEVRIGVRIGESVMIYEFNTKLNDFLSDIKKGVLKSL